MKLTRLQIPTIVLAVVALVVGVGGGAVGAKLITGADIKDGSIATKDLKKGAVNSAKIKDGSVAGKDIKKATISSGKLADGSVSSAKIKDGAVGPNDLSQAAKDSFSPAYGETNWSVVDRNVIGNGDSFLRAGPSFQLGAQLSQPPMGVGSLGIRTGSPDDKAAFGDQVDFSGDDFTAAAITAVDYWVFTTGENITGGNGAVNLPSVEFEINPNLTAQPTDVFSTAVFIPPATANLPGWNDIDAVNTGEWFLTGQTGTDVNCNQTTTCTFAEMMANLDDSDGTPPSIFTAEISKGRDFAFSGAVDALTIGADVFDFEPFGVVKSAAPAPKK